MGLGFQGHVFEGCFDFEKFGVFLICLRVDLLLRLWLSAWAGGWTSDGQGAGGWTSGNLSACGDPPVAISACGDPPLAGANICTAACGDPPVALCRCGRSIQKWS